MIGKSRGGNTTKIHVATDLKGIPVRILLSKGNVHDIKLADKLIENLDVKTVLGDKGYDSDKFRKLIKNSVIPGRVNRKIPINYDKQLYKKRNVVERFFQKIKRFRRISTRYEQKAENFLSMVLFTSSIVIMKSMNVDVA